MIEKSIETIKIKAKKDIFKQEMYIFFNFKLYKQHSNDTIYKKKPCMHHFLLLFLAYKCKQKISHIHILTKLKIISKKIISN